MATLTRRHMFGLMMAGAAGLGLGGATRERSALAAGSPATDEAGEACSRPALPPLPNSGDPAARSIWARYREPLPPVPAYNAPGRKKVGLQAGHWLVEQVPTELRGLGHGATGGGKAEWEVNLDVARRMADLLRAADVEAEVLPATVPIEYRAHVFLSIHADGDESGRLRGYKLGRAAWSATPEADDRLMALISDEYGRATGLPIDPIGASRRMTAYYAFNSRRYCHAISPGTASAILEMGFLTNATDRETLLGNPDAIARGVTEGVLAYLATLEHAGQPDVASRAGPSASCLTAPRLRLD